MIKYQNAVAEIAANKAFSRFDTVPACDRQTDRRTDGRPDYIYYVLQHS